jgi:hypothetical protein
MPSDPQQFSKDLIALGTALWAKLPSKQTSSRYCTF